MSIEATTGGDHELVRVPEQRSGSTSPPPVRRLLGMPLHALTLDDTVRRVMRGLDAGRGGTVLTPNIDILRHYLRSPELRVAFERIEILVADGMPLVVGLRWQRTPVPGQVTGTDLLRGLVAEAAARGRTVALVGGPPGTATRALDRLRAVSPGLRARALPCFVRPETEAHELAVLADALAETAPEIVFVGLPFPAQVALADRLRELLPGTWVVGVGSSFELVNGARTRPPRWVQRACLEWAWRLGAQPQLWRRYLVDGVPVVARMLTSALCTRWRRGASWTAGPPP